MSFGWPPPGKELYFMTPKGEAYLLYVVDYGINMNGAHCMALCSSGEVFYVSSEELKYMGNEMLDIPDPLPFSGRKIK